MKAARPSQPPFKEHFVRVTPELWNAVDSYASVVDETTSTLVRQALIEFLTTRKWPLSVTSARAARKLTQSARNNSHRMTYLRMDEAARRLGVNRNTIYRWVRDGKLTPIPPPPGVREGLRFARADIEHLLAERGEPQSRRE